VPYSSHWLALTSAAALVTAVLLAVSTLLRLGFLADFLSRTVLIGFLSGVGVSLIAAQLPDMLGIVESGSGFAAHVAAVARHASEAHIPTVAMAIGVVLLIVTLEWIAPALPGSLVAVALAIASTWLFRLDHHGIAVVGPVHSGLPGFGVPRVSAHELVTILPTCASMFLVILAQSAATSRSFAQKYDEQLDENRDLLALAAANAVAGLSSTFVVNGSPTKTAIADAAGSRTQLAQLTTAVVVLVVLLAATPLIERLPLAALAALVFLIGLKLIDVKSLREVYSFRRTTFAVAIATLAAVVWFGVERGIFVAIALSVLDHLQQEFHPKDVVLTLNNGGWKAERANPGLESQPGLVVYRFEAPLFFANADHFAQRVREVVKAAPHPVKWVVFDMVSTADIDYTGGLTFAATLRWLQQQDVTIVLSGADDLMQTLTRTGILDMVGSTRRFASALDAIEAFRRSQGPPLSTQS
jgi:SulP family sulfate permease